MKTASKAELVTQVAQLSRDNTVLGIALNYQANGEFVLVGRSHNYTVRIADPIAAHGGIVMVTFAPKGQRPYTSAHYLDDWCGFWCNKWVAGDDPEQLAYRDLAQKARAIAYEMQHAASVAA